jgi:hypothetical protein
MIKISPEFQCTKRPKEECPECMFGAIPDYEATFLLVFDEE